MKSDTQMRQARGNCLVAARVARDEPLDGAEEVIVAHARIRNRYLLGKRALCKLGQSQWSAVERPAVGEAQELEDARRIPLSELGARFKRPNGRVESEDGGLDEIETADK